jgi:hypothetical protein
MFASEIYDEVLQAWEADQRRGNKEQIALGRSDLQTLLDTAFRASLKREEGRSITFALVLVPRSSFVENEWDDAGQKQILRFDKELPLQVEAITKLATAFDAHRTALIVTPPVEASENYLIPGAIFFYPRFFTWNPFDVSPGRADLTQLFRPDAFTVSALSPGSLLISRGDTQLGRFVSGEFIQSTPSPLHTASPIKRYLQKLTSYNAGLSDGSGTTYLHWFIWCLDYLVGKVSNHCHGATIIVIDPEQSTEYEKNFTGGYTVAGTLKLEYLITEILQTGNRTDEHSVTTNRLCKLQCEKRLGLLSQLACVDGALILSSHLEVLVFGARFTASEVPPEEVTVADGDAGFDLSRLGNRHKSAVNFVHKTGTFGFVISEDGPIRGLVKQNGKVLCYPNCRFRTFV